MIVMDDTALLLVLVNMMPPVFAAPVRLVESMLPGCFQASTSAVGAVEPRSMALSPEVGTALACVFKWLPPKDARSLHQDFLFLELSHNKAGIVNWS